MKRCLGLFFLFSFLLDSTGDTSIIWMMYEHTTYQQSVDSITLVSNYRDNPSKPPADTRVGGLEVGRQPY